MVAAVVVVCMMRGLKLVWNEEELSVSGYEEVDDAWSTVVMSGCAMGVWI